MYAGLSNLCAEVDEMLVLVVEMVTKTENWDPACNKA